MIQRNPLTALLTLALGCASVPSSEPTTTASTPVSLERARSTTDYTRSVLELLDQQFAPMLDAALKRADAQAPTDEAAFHALAAPEEPAHLALESARSEHALLVIGLQVWSQDGDPTHWLSALPCMVAALERVVVALPTAELKEVASAALVATHVLLPQTSACDRAVH